MIIGIGTDIIEIDRIKQAVTKTPNFLEKLFTDKEKTYFKSIIRFPCFLYNAFNSLWRNNNK